MAFVSLGDSGSTPSFLELIAAHKLDRSIRDAFSYVLSIVADRVPQGGLRLLQMDAELYLLFSLLVQGTSLLTNGASLAESLYGLRRASARTGGQPSMASPSLRQLWLSIFFLAGAPYMANIVFGEPSAAALPLAVQGPVPTESDAELNDEPPHMGAAMQPEAQGAAQAVPDNEASAPEAHVTTASATVLQRICHSCSTSLSRAAQLAQVGLVHVRRHGHMATGLLNLGYETAFLLKQTRFFSPALHCAGVTLVRDDGSQTRARLQAQADTRRRLWQRGVSDRAPAALAAAALLRGIHAVGNNAKTSLLATLILFKVLEWWFTAGEERVAEARRAVPPPPPAYPPHAAGVPLIADASVCPVCHRKRVAPAQLATSGYVFCYKCAYSAVAAHGCCPVTHIRSTLDDIRRLFLSS
eukprot:jgi/Ulvmu1/10922/UM007_0101.1